METVKARETKTTLVLGGTGKTGRRVTERLKARGLPVRVGSRSGELPFDWEDRATWEPALRDIGSVYVSYYPDLAVPGVSAAGASLGALVYRYLRKTDPVGRQQVKWVVSGITTGLGGIIVVALLDIVFPALGPPSLFDVLGVRSAQILLLLLIPLSIGLAILRYRLWHIDIIINRTIVYGALTACVVGIYVFIVGYLGELFRVNGSLTISLVATGVVAVLFAPLRDRLQRAVNRLMYGERDEPYAVLSRLGQRLEGTLAPGAVLPAIVETVAGRSGCRTRRSP